MADTQRTKAQLLALLADNVTGQVSCQDIRDWLVTVMDTEFVNPGDFWAKPSVAGTLTDKTARGWKLYSQYAGSDLTWAALVYMEASTGYWMRADVADSAHNGMVGLMMDSYLSDVSTCQVLLEGLVYHSAWSTTFSELIGRPVYLGSTGSLGSITIAETGNSIYILGYIAHSDDFGGSAIGKFYFKPEWSIKGS